MGSRRRAGFELEERAGAGLDRGCRGVVFRALAETETVCVLWEERSERCMGSSSPWSVWKESHPLPTEASNKELADASERPPGDRINDSSGKQEGVVSAYNTHRLQAPRTLNHQMAR